MAVSKVVLGDETLIDLTGDSVSSENLLQGATAHAANGEQITGGVVVTPMYTGTKAAIEEAIALGQIPEDAVVNITDDEETSSFQTQINEINSSFQASIGELSNSLTWWIENGYLPEPLSIVPTMTSNNSPLGVASASSVKDKNYAYLAFNDNDADYWYSENNGLNTASEAQYIQWYNPNKVYKFNKVMLYNSASDFNNPKGVDVYGVKSDGSIEFIQSLSLTGTPNKKPYSISTDKKYSGLRIVITKNNDGSMGNYGGAFMSIQFYGTE